MERERFCCSGPSRTERDLEGDLGARGRSCCCCCCCMGRRTLADDSGPEGTLGEGTGRLVRICTQRREHRSGEGRRSSGSLAPRARKRSGCSAGLGTTRTSGCPSLAFTAASASGCRSCSAAAATAVQVAATDGLDLVRSFGRTSAVAGEKQSQRRYGGDESRWPRRVCGGSASEYSIDYSVLTSPHVPPSLGTARVRPPPSGPMFARHQPASCSSAPAGEGCSRVPCIGHRNCSD